MSRPITQRPQCKVEENGIRCKKISINLTGIKAGLCSMHGDRLKTKGLVGPIKRLLFDNLGKKCKDNTCENDAIKIGFCEKHYNMQPDRAAKRSEYFNNEGIKAKKKEQAKIRNSNITDKQRSTSLSRRYGKLIRHIRNCDEPIENLCWTFDLWLEKLMSAGGDCKYCNGKFGSILENTTGHSMDRIDNSLGHHPDNCIPACGYCNKLRSNKFTVDEFQIIIDVLVASKENKLNTKNLKEISEFIKIKVNNE